ncbi:MAG: cysteine dioxygenase family protein [Nitriliruptoraceae bacterium]|nr:cysteine dioxygenase family protein [Nitriliruptoraceae bacterium]
MIHPALARFIERMDTLVDSTDDPHKIADVTGDLVAEHLLSEPDFLEDRHRVPSDDEYQQHVVHVHPEGKYSIVSLVWQPGQATPIHDHRCWCVVGVLEGKEREERYAFHAEGDQEWLTDEGVGVYDPGQVCRLVPPDEDIHRVVNASESQSISMHIYGADISQVGTSINRVFDLPIRERVEAAGTDASWRERDPGLPAH